MKSLSLVSLGALALAMSACSPAEPSADETAPPPPAGGEISDDAATDTAAGETPAYTMALEPAEELQLIKLDCGTIYVSDLNIFSVEGDYAGQTDTFTDTCWLVRHPDGDLLWDLGLPGELVEAGEQTQDVFTVSLEKTISDQLIEMGLGMSDVEMVAISHSHFDHVGQAGDIDPSTTWLVNETEYGFMFPDAGAESETEGQSESQFPAFESLTRETIGDNHDVFGDGSVIIMETPGHTPGHSSLLVNLPETGPIFLTGDLYHREESREGERVPAFNTDVEQTRASMAEFEARAEELGARVIIQHEPADTNDLPDVMR
ncbi:MAG TPA: N-acyl homoserine lactonase family protein [Henriciella marina]|uniref:N-acyl homoserine lactonase family protein n=1 Tax=Henriciella sp. TaxID=1968823 RepID=UPI0017EAE42E|nr:N-acyl homoserine lactonase family protein [Henriciella sp.]HIG21209.1 N-acyl homoserine lactonase family protein [Henriciella sp.]HIK66094.1 N-acyl homoserine lactonase family protein [Henriciella marina]